MHHFHGFLASLVIIVHIIGPSAGADANCTLLRSTFGRANSNFTLCAVDYSRPIHMCENCVNSYIEVLNSYSNMSNFSDVHGPCIDSFINKDRLQILKTLYMNSVNLWNRAKCYECFEIKDGILTPVLSNETKVFDALHSSLMNCVNGSTVNETTMCPICMKDYTNLNNYYYSISNENEKIGVCMDIVDVMNTTRSYWSDKCCKYRRHEEYIFLGTTGFAFLVAVLFYLLAKVCTDKKVTDVLPQNRFAGSFNISNET